MQTLRRWGPVGLAAVLVLIALRWNHWSGSTQDIAFGAAMILALILATLWAAWLTLRE